MTVRRRFPAKRTRWLDRIRDGLISDARATRRNPRWLLLIPCFLFLGFSILYASIAFSLRPPAQVITGAKGIEILDRNGQLVLVC